ERIEEATVRCYGALAFHAIGPLLSVEYQATQVVVHENIQRPPALIAQGSRQVPAAQQRSGRTMESLPSWQLPTVAEQEHMRRVILAQSPLAHMRTRRVLEGSIYTVSALCTLSSVIIRPGVSVGRTELHSVRKTLFQDYFQGIVDTAARRHIAP